MAADPYCPQHGSAVVALLPLLLPYFAPSSSSSNDNNSNSSSSRNNHNNNNSATSIRGTDKGIPTSTFSPSTQFAMKSGLIVATKGGVFTIWDLSQLAHKLMGKKPGPTCLQRLCVWEHPAASLFNPISEWEHSISILGATPLPRSASNPFSKEESEVRGIEDSKDNNLLCVTFGGGESLVMDLLLRRLGPSLSSIGGCCNCTCRSSSDGGATSSTALTDRDKEREKVHRSWCVCGSSKNKVYTGSSFSLHVDGTQPNTVPAIIPPWRSSVCITPYRLTEGQPSYLHLSDLSNPLSQVIHSVIYIFI